jgi:exocyst complex protein 7
MHAPRPQAVNALLDKVVGEQAAWSIPDLRLRRAVTRVICQDFLPPYSHFWDTYVSSDFTSNPAKYVCCSKSRLSLLV